MNKRGALEISFGWLFAIIVGAFILFLAIYFVTRIFQTEQETINAKTGKEIGVLLNPLEISFETAKSISIDVPAETRINNTCDNTGNFGRQFVQLSQKSFNRWVSANTKNEFYNKYIFSDEQTESKKFYFFSKPFNFPFKVADLIFLTSAKQRYCFSGFPEEIEEEINATKQDNLLVNNCKDGDRMVCYDSSNSECDIRVYSSGVVKKQEGELKFILSGDEGNENSLMYAAIFSSPEIYECQIKRLMSRLKELSAIYKEKEEIINEKGCENDLGASLTELSNNAGEIESSGDLVDVKNYADLLNSQNEMAECKLW